MFVLTQDYYDDSRFLGIFNTAESAQNAGEIMANLSSPVWTELNDGILTTEQGEGYLSVRPAATLKNHLNEFSNSPASLPEE